MKKTTNFLIVFVMAFGFGSCKDKESPEVLIVSPGDDAHFSQGTYFSYEVKVTDDRGLAQIREYIGDENGVASSEIVSTSVTTPNGNREKEYTATTGFDLSMGVTGEFYIWLEASDKAGKSKKTSKRFHVDP